MTQDRHEVELRGCAPTPLSHYLKALGILRVIAEQEDPQATGHWVGEHFVLRSLLDRAALTEFFLRRYRPTPIVSPWNGGSGFYPKDNSDAINALAQSQADRLQEYRQSIEHARDVVTTLDLSGSPKGDDKHRLLQQLRGEVSASALAWLDAAIALTTDDPKYPPLLGTGGNDGNLEFSRNFMQRLVELFDCETGEPTVTAIDTLPHVLFAEATPNLDKSAIGQFSPGAAGGPNGTTGFDAPSFVNPWDLVLLLEGALAFASATTRRLASTSSGSLSYPFTVRPTGAGSGATAMTDEAPARAEMWMPLWTQPAQYSEIKSLFSEGRVTLGRRAVRDGFDFSRAIAELGVDRGIAGFVRFGFLMRSGKAYLAAPLERMQVAANPVAQLISDLDSFRFLEKLRRLARSDLAPTSIQSLVHRLENELIAMTKRASARRHVQEALCLLGEIQTCLGRSAKGREGVDPVPRLSEEWAKAANDGTHEFRLAAGIGGLGSKATPMRLHMAPIDRGNKWNDHDRLAVWHRGPLVDNLVTVLRRRLVTSRQSGDDSDSWQAMMLGSSAADLNSISALLDGQLDHERTARLARGLALVRLPFRLPSRPQPACSVPASFAVLKLLLTPTTLLQKAELLPSDAPSRTQRSRLVGALAAGRVDAAVQLAWRQARIAGLRLPPFPRQAPSAAHLDGRRLAAALLIPLDLPSISKLARQVVLAEATRQQPSTISQEGDAQ